MNAGKKILFSLLLVLSVLALFAADKALIWEVVKTGQPGKIYLVGSIHLGRADWYPLDSVYDKVLKESQEMYFEIFEPDMTALAMTISTKGMYPPDKNLSGVIGKTQFAELTRFFAENGSKTPPFLLEKMRPWLISIELAGLYVRKEKALKSYYGLEKVFTANRGERPGHSLESIDSQMNAMASIPDDVMIQSILKSIRDPEKAKRELDATLASLHSGDIAKLAEMCGEIARETPEIYRKLFTERNTAIAKKLLLLLKEKKVFFVLVGAGHFAGKDNIRDLLAKAGCRIIQLEKTGKKGAIKGAPPEKRPSAAPSALPQAGL